MDDRSLPNKNCALKLAKLFFSYGKTAVLENVDLSIDHGSLIGIIGPNGGGKTTLLKLILGFLSPTKGQVLLFGAPPHEIKKKLGYVPQLNRTDKDFPITVLELVMLGTLTNRPTYLPGSKEKAIYWIEELGLLPYCYKPFSSLSGGLAQRVLLARALVSDPEILLLDEPTANVDPHSKEIIIHKLREMRGKKTTLLVTHDLKTIAEGIDLILCVEKKVISYLPHEVCHHFALGLYHPPLYAPGKEKGLAHVP